MPSVVTKIPLISALEVDIVLAVIDNPCIADVSASAAKALASILIPFTISAADNAVLTSAEISRAFTEA